MRGGGESWQSLEKTVPRASHTSSPAYGKAKKGTMWLHWRLGGHMETGQTVQIRPDHSRFASRPDTWKAGELKPEGPCSEQKPRNRKAVNLACVVQRQPSIAVNTEGWRERPSVPSGSPVGSGGRKRKEPAGSLGAVTLDCLLKTVRGNNWPE